GDLDYLSLSGGGRAPNGAPFYPRLWMAALDAELGRAHPVFVAAGNHDVESGVFFEPEVRFPREPTYAQLILARAERQGLASHCTGPVGGDVACSFGGLLTLQRYVSELQLAGAVGGHIHEVNVRV